MLKARVTLEGIHIEGTTARFYDVFLHGLAIYLFTIYLV